ncbi:MAG: DUF177 domain-containing protein [Acidobacteria bacterium]|nr:DUF177 domain-containing protein [Acidobacteriota bacterium]
MEINVSQIDEHHGLSLEQVYPQGEPTLEEADGQLIGRTILKFRATREGEEVLLRGSIQTAVQFDCDRCLTKFTLPITQNFDLLYLPGNASRKAHEEHELQDDDLSIAYYQGQVIELDDLVREQIQLTLPMSRLCQEACRGLCAECGADLNEGQCSCAAEASDPRWTALKELKNQ